MADSEGVSKRFDPRFSPAFQPGYDARVHREEPPSSPLREEPRADRSDLRTPQRPEPVARPEFGRPEFALAEFGLGELGLDEPSETESGDPVSAEPLPWWRRFNPWFVVLWVLGVVFIGIGMFGIQLLTDGTLMRAYASGGNQFISMLFQTIMLGSPMLIVLGLATLTSTIVILAARWKRA